MTKTSQGRVVIKAINRCYLAVTTGDKLDPRFRHFLWQHTTCIIKHKIPAEMPGRDSPRMLPRRKRQMSLFHIFSSAAWRGRRQSAARTGPPVLLWVRASINLPTFEPDQYGGVHRNVDTWRTGSGSRGAADSKRPLHVGTPNKSLPFELNADFFCEIQKRRLIHESSSDFFQSFPRPFEIFDAELR